MKQHVFMSTTWDHFSDCLCELFCSFALPKWFFYPVCCLQEPNLPAAPVMCANHCGFYGNPVTGNCCSVCWKKTHKEEAVAAPKVEVVLPTAEEKTSEESTGAPGGSDDLDEKKVQTKKNRCWECNKKIGILGIECRCEYVFCGAHRQPFDHKCSFDFKSMQQRNIEKVERRVVFVCQSLFVMHVLVDCPVRLSVCSRLLQFFSPRQTLSSRETRWNASKFTSN